MAVDGVRVYAVFSTGDLVALDLEGQRVWAKNLGLPDNPYGYASSLITYKDLLIVQYDQWEHSKVLALDGATGKIVWERPRDMEISVKPGDRVLAGTTDLARPKQRGNGR